MCVSYESMKCGRDSSIERIRITRMDTSNSHEIETMPLIPAKNSKKLKTPLPKLQIGILISLHLVEPIASTSIFPYINQLIRELGITGGNDVAVGYYAGIIESLFFAAQALTVLRWGRLSDCIGRKLVLVIGLLGACILILCFGLSTTFWSLVISRCLCGFLNGNVGVMKTMMGELMDSTNMTQAFALFPIVGSIGSFIGPLIDHWPVLFANTFWEKFPYFLPCAVAACLFILAILMMSFFLEEVVSAMLSISSDELLPQQSMAYMPFGIFQALFFARIINWIGPKHLFCVLVSCYIPLMAMFPIMSWIVRVRGEVDHAITFALLCLTGMQLPWFMAFGAIFMFITASAPTNNVLVAINGLGQTSALVACVIGPTLATSLFAVSKEHNLLGGNAVFVVLIVLAGGLRWLASQLPDEVQDRDE
ncbi:MFS general substrate transporter [Suillus hirtellus]|nr:MFS general substrate transporter [Suillus hirtellus]